MILDGCVGALNLHSTACGFPWYAVPKVEHHLVGVRHIQSHAAQLAAKVRAAARLGLR